MAKRGNKKFRLLNREVLLKKEGFSLIELIVVIVVVSILTGVVGFSVNTMNKNTRLQNAANRAMADVRHAHELAMAHRREVDVLVSSANENYEIKWHDTGLYVRSPIDQNDLIVTFGQGEYHDVSITSSGLGGRLSFNAIGEPLINGASFTGITSVMLLNSKVNVAIYPSGYVCLIQSSG